MYLVRPREGRISTMKIKNMYTLVIMIRFSPDLQEVRGEHPVLQALSGSPCRVPIALGEGARAPGHPLGPVRLQQRRVVDNGREQGREGPQEEGWEELADDGVLENKVHSRESWGLRGHGLLAWWLSEWRGWGSAHPRPPAMILCLVQGRDSIMLAKQTIITLIFV